MTVLGEQVNKTLERWNDKGVDIYKELDLDDRSSRYAYEENLYQVKKAIEELTDRMQDDFEVLAYAWARDLILELVEENTGVRYNL